MDRDHSSPRSRTLPSSFARLEPTWTDDSNFQDSAVDMDTPSTPSQEVNAVDKDTGRPAQSLSPISQSLADRMRRLAAAAWTLEQDDEMSILKRQRIEQKLHGLEEIMEASRVSEAESIPVTSKPEYGSQRQATAGLTDPGEDEEDSCVEESDLFQVHDNLAEIVASMRLRQQEQRHLHILTATKLEAVAQRCLFQEQQMQDLLKEMKSLRVENRSLGEDNDRLRQTIAELELEASQKEVAVSAMTSAVAGLEGWIDDADRARADQLLPIMPPIREKRQRRAVVRGKGRFRGRYYIDEEHDQHSRTDPDAQDIQDGVRAWIRGFRDVEDACSSPAPGRPKELYHGPIGIHEDDWGEFELPANTSR